MIDVNYGGVAATGAPTASGSTGGGGSSTSRTATPRAHLVAIGKADPDRLAIRGGSAGGYTTLAALTFLDTFKAGASYYGISDIEVLARDTTSSSRDTSTR